MGFPFVDMEIDVAQHFPVADIYMKVFNMQHNTIEECMSIAALNAFQQDIINNTFGPPWIVDTGPFTVILLRSVF